MSQQSKSNAAVTANNPQKGVSPDTAVAKQSPKPFRKRRCTDCKENFVSRLDVTKCQNCGDAPDKTEQSIKEDKVKRKAQAVQKTKTPQVTPSPQEPAKQKN